MGYLSQPYQLLICLQLLVLYFHCSAKLCSHDQSSALLQFKQIFSFEKDSSSSCDGFQPSRPKMISWKEDTDCCSWDGVTCDMATGHVIGLDLSCSWLQGNILFNSSLFSLPHLRKLNLAFNDFNYSKIFSGFNQFPRLTFLNLSSSNFTGSIPASLGNITQLAYLDLSYNTFSGLVPSSFSNLQQLQILNLLSNNFIGKIPQLPPLITFFSVHNNNLTGEIPLSFCNLSFIEDLSLSINCLTGQIPQCLENSTLQYLVLKGNNFHGSIPQLPPSMTHFTVATNNLSGEIPLSFCNLSSIEYLYLSDNNLSGKIPQCIGNSKFKSLCLEINNFHGSIPQLPPLITYFSVSNNNLTKEIPSSFCNLSAILYLDLSYNNLTGQIPQCLGNSIRVELEIKMNNYEVRTPVTYAKGSNLAYLMLNDNHLEGPIPPSLVNCVGLMLLDVGINSLSGPIPRYLGNSAPKILNMRMNNFNGSIPLTFAKSCHLTNLNLNGNQLEGPLPPSLVNCRHLQVLDVGNNKINDTFPHWLEILPELQILILRSNKFWGPIGDITIRVSFPKLRIVDLSHNELTGVLPTRYLENFKAMINNNSVEVRYMESFAYYESINLTIKGNDMEMDRILSLFVSIDLSSNRFHGGIPEVVGKLSSLKGLNISHNNLTGNIPLSLGNLTELESLDLSSNFLVGSIPMQLASLKYLSVLKLSNNHLEGQIPRGRQFNTFQNDSYAGNLGLCGFPLSKSCGVDEAPPTRFHEGGHASRLFEWKFAVMGYGSGVVIGLSIGYIVFATRRPRWFVKMIGRKYYQKVRILIKRGTARN